MIKSILLAGGIVLPSLTFAAPQTITLDGEYLERARDSVKADGFAGKAALDALIARADEAMARPPETVTAKTVTPPSGDKHDYMSIGPYWWPNPESKDGLPYVRKDGETNPSSKNDDTDSVRLQRMGDAVLDLALAAYFTGSEDYARKSAEDIRVWFLDDAMAMNPNLRFGQSIPGVVDGRGIGLIDTRNLWKVIDAERLLAEAGAFSAEEEEALQTWFSDFLNWMQTSPQGHEEYTWHNNHGAFYDAQVANYALFIGDEAAAHDQVADAIHLRMASHFAKDGQQHAELERTRPFHYSIFNLEAHLRLARYGELTDVDYWNVDQDGRTLKQGVKFVLSEATSPSPDIFGASEKTMTPETLAIALQAARGWGDEVVEPGLLDALEEASADSIVNLLWASAQ